MRTTEDISYPTIALMLIVFVGLALLSNFTQAENVNQQHASIVNTMDDMRITE